MDFFEKYLIDCDIDFSTARHLIGKKTLYSYDTFDSETKNMHNEIFTIYYTIKDTLHAIEHEMLSIHQINPMLKNLSYNTALIKITRSMNEILYDMLTTLALSNMNLMINQSYRQMIEYFCVYFVLSKSDDAIASFYMNHNHISEAKARMKMSSALNDNNLEITYKQSINLFAMYHNLSFKDAEEIYTKPFGWAYNIIKDSEGNIIERPTSKRIREYAFSQLNKDLSWSVINITINTADEVVHPTPAYLFYIINDDEDRRFSEVVFNTSITFYSIILGMTAKIFEKQKERFDLFTAAAQRVREIKTNPIFSNMEFQSDYSEIKKINKYTYRNYDDSDDNSLIYLEHINNEFFNKDTNNKMTYKYLDLVYTLSDTIFLNLRNFVNEIVPTSATWVNLLSLYRVSAFLMHEMAASFAFGNYSLFQKVFRLFVEYTAILDYLLCHNETTNKNFFDSGYLLLIHTHMFNDINVEDFDELLQKIKARVGISTKDYDEKILDFCGWTIHKNKKNKFVTFSFGYIVNEFQKKIDPDKGVFKMILNECNATLHGSLYGEEINNDIIDNSTVPFDYMMILFRIFITIHQGIGDYFEKLADDKLYESNQLMIGTFIGMYKKYGKYVLKKMKEYM